MPAIVAKLIIYVAKGAMLQDRIVWESRLYNQKPVLVKGDGPFPKHRAWWSQFYSDNSRNVTYGNGLGAHSLDW
jgi:hypothetical protein